MWFRIGLIAATFALCATASLACSCAPGPPGRCQLPTASVAFVGTVISKQPVDFRPPIEPATSSGNREARRRSAQDPAPPRDESHIAVTLQVTEPLRGDFEKTILIRTDAANNSCSFPFEAGHDYLVFAYLRNSNLYTNICAGTQPAKPEAALIRQLRAARAGTGMADVFGLVTEPLSNSSLAGLERFEPARALTVTAKSALREYRTQTSNDGSYEFWGLPPGRYGVTLQLPPARVTSQAYTLDVAPGTPCRADFQISYDGRIGGTVVNRQGQPMSGIISAQHAEPERANDNVSVASVDDGHFDLKTVSPGRYRLQFLPRVNGRIRSNDAYYYPGTKVEAEAVELEVGDGARVEGLQLTVP
jgi:hypothetical protein